MQPAPSLGAAVAQAAANAEVHGAVAALRLLDAVPGISVQNYQPYWAVRAHLLHQLGRAEAAAAYDRAVGLTEDPALREFLRARQASDR
jgi:predicted RNA polymerase sigma factor